MGAIDIRHHGDLRPVGCSCSYWQEHPTDPGSPQGPCCPEAFRSCWKAWQSRQAFRQIQGTQIRVCSWSQRVSWLQEVIWISVLWILIAWTFVLAFCLGFGKSI